MPRGTYADFREALLAFESGWDTDRYAAGVIQDWQLNQWAGGNVSDFFPQYSSWSELSGAEWRSMAFQSTNQLGFVGYQFGEALLIDLGYYEDDLYYGNGAPTNTWDGTWTGKNGVTSLDEFKTESAQELAIQEAFGFNLNVIQSGLAANGETLDDYIGSTRSFVDNGEPVSVELTLSGIMAASHLRGAWGTLDLLQNGSVTADENGTSILKYMSQFGDFETPNVEHAISVYTAGALPDTSDATPFGDVSGNSEAEQQPVDGGANTDTAQAPQPAVDLAPVPEASVPSVPAPNDSPIIAAYYPEWGIYSRDYNIADIPADQLTHLIYAFARIDEQGKISLFDSFAATDKAFTAAESVDGIADSWTSDGVRGNFNQIAELKAQNPELTTMIAIGGWTLSGNFSTMAATAEGRETFAESVKDFLVTYDMFDGVDLDWEYPGGGGLAGNAVSPDDGANYALLAQSIRGKLNELEAETGREYELSVASPAGSDKIANFNLEGLEPHIDFFNLMAYDFYGAWQNTTGHQAAFYDLTGNGYDITTAVDLYQQSGVPSEKIVLGAPMYTRAWGGVDANTPMDAWNASATGAAPGTFEAGVYDYKDIIAKTQDPQSAWKLYYDDDAQAAFVYNADLNIFSSIETPETISLKSEWAQAEGLGGMMFWDLSNDSAGPESLLKAGADSWLNGLTFDEIAANSALEWDGVFGGDGEVAPIAEADTSPVVPTPSPPIDAAPDAPEVPAPAPTPEPEPAPEPAPTPEPDLPVDPVPPAEEPMPEPQPPAEAPSAGPTDATPSNANVTIDWSWGSNVEIQGFDPANGTVSIGWVGADHLEIGEVDGNTVISIPSNNQSTTLVGVRPSQLTMDNFSVLDEGAAREIAGIVGTQSSESDQMPPTAGTPDPVNPGPVEPEPPEDLMPMDGEPGDMPGDMPHDHGNMPHDHGGMPMQGKMISITSNTPAQVINGFNPAVDMLHIESDVTADRFGIFEESTSALGTSVRLEIQTGTGLNQVILPGIGLSDLTFANFNIANQGVFNEVTAAIGETITNPGSQGYTLVDDADGSNPATTTGMTDAGGVKWKADFNSDDIWGADPTIDQIDVGATSVHGMIVTKSETGEVVIDSPWTAEAQILQGVTFDEIGIDFFGVVGNEHFRQDIGGVVSWEKNIGPRDDDTFYVRSHEYGVDEVIDGFDPTTDKISFLYFGTRERLNVEDTEDGLKISSLPTGQSATFTNVKLADLRPGLVEFHHDQVIEDNLELPFGFSQDQVTLVDRSALLTPQAPAGASTDGFQTRLGDVDGNGVADVQDAQGNSEAPQSDAQAPITPPTPAPGIESPGSTLMLGADGDTVALDWSWGQEKQIVGFDPAQDKIDLGTFSADQLAVREVDGNVGIEVLGNGGDVDWFMSLQVDDLTLENFVAPEWSEILDEDSEFRQELTELGM